MGGDIGGGRFGGLEEGDGGGEVFAGLFGVTEVAAVDEDDEIAVCVAVGTCTWLLLTIWNENVVGLKDVIGGVLMAGHAWEGARAGVGGVFCCLARHG